MSVDNDGEWTEVHDDDAFDEDSVIAEDAHAGDDAIVVPFGEATSVDLETVPPMNYEEAKKLTENIRATADVLYVLIQRAHAGRAWEPLGYTSFESYVREEFNISRSRAYQLLNQANVIQQIESAAPEGTRININEATVRDLKGVMDELLPNISDATDGMSPDEASEFIHGMLDEARDEQRESKEEFEGGDSYNEEYAADQADREGFSGGGYGGGGEGGYGGGQHGPVDSISPDDDDDDDDMPDLPDMFAFEDDSNPMEMRQRLESVYNLYSALSALQGMLDAEKMVEFIPEERRIQVEASLGPAIQWLQEFKQAWEQQKDSDVNNDDSVPHEEKTETDFASQINSDGDETNVFADIN